MNNNIRKTITLGRSNDNDVILTNGDISSKHARITMLDDDKYEVEDLDSTNGTYVNGYRIKKAEITGSEQLRLSANLIVEVPPLFGKKQPKVNLPKVDKKNPMDYTKEFSKLEHIYNNYKRDRATLIKKHNQKLSLIRGAITLSPMILLILNPDIKAQFMGIMVVGSTAAGFLTSGMTPQDKLDQLDRNFRLIYLCPKEDCRHQLNGMDWAILHNTGYCPRCGAIYNINKLK